MVREKHGALYPERAIYRVTLKPQTTPDGVPDGANATPQRQWRGRVVIAGRWSIPAWRYLRSAATLFWREAGF